MRLNSSLIGGAEDRRRDLTISCFIQERIIATNIGSDDGARLRIFDIIWNERFIWRRKGASRASTSMQPMATRQAAGTW